MTTIRAAIYLRQSLDQTGDGLAVERQREDCERIARERGWNVVEVYTDNSISASKKTVKRPAYDRLLSDFGSGRFDALICYDLDRLTRQPRQLEDWIEAAETRGLRLVTANGEADLTTDGGRTFARIKAAVARGEVERKSARQIRALQQRAEKGRPPSGVRLTGYTLAGDVIPAEAAIVRQVFDVFHAGEPLRRVALMLDESGTPTRSGARWNPSTVRTMLTNPRYAGRAVYRGKANGVEGQWAAIVDGDVFDAVQARLNDPRRITNRHGTERKHLGSGLYLCGVCGDPVRTNGTRYWCPKGGHITRSMPRVDDFVSAAVVDFLRRVPNLAEVLAKRDDPDADAHRDTLAALRARLVSIEADYDAGHIDGQRFATASSKVRAEIQAAAAELARRQGSQGASAVLTSNDPGEAFTAGSLAARRAVIDLLFSVRLHPAPRGSRTFDNDSVTMEMKVGNDV